MRGDRKKGGKKGGRGEAESGRTRKREVGKEESGKGHEVHPRCFLMWPSVDLLPSFPHYSVRHAICFLNRHCVPLHYQS